MEDLGEAAESLGVPSLLADPEEEWGWIHMRPGASPLNALASAAGRLVERRVAAEPGAIARALAGWREEHSGRPLLLVVDQLEELFTQGAERGVGSSPPSSGASPATQARP